MKSIRMILGIAALAGTLFTMPALAQMGGGSGTGTQNGPMDSMTNSTEDLIIPAGVRGFVSFDDGSVSLNKIIIPVATQPHPQSAIVAAAHLAQQLQCRTGEFILLHVADQTSAPAVTTPSVPGWRWRKQIKSGDVIETIVETALETNADLIVMSTSGRHGFLDALRGSHSERVLRHSPCPLLAIPENSQAAGGMTLSRIEV